MCEEKYCGSCEIFFENPLGCPYSKRAEMPACEKFRATERITRTDMLRLASKEQFAKIFALVASCEGCPARTEACDITNGKEYNACLIQWITRLEGYPRAGDIVDMFLEE